MLFAGSSSGLLACKLVPSQLHYTSQDHLPWCGTATALTRLDPPASVGNQDSASPHGVTGLSGLGNSSVRAFLSDDSRLCQVDKAKWDS